MDLKKRIMKVAGLILLITLAGSAGYFLIFRQEASFLDCMYMTVISLTTVGYGEVVDVSGSMPAQVFTMALIVSGMGIMAYGLSMVTATVVEGELSGIIRKKKMLRKIRSLSDHYIVCGGGETGRPVLEELIKNRARTVLIEQDQERIDTCMEVIPDLIYIHGDATDDANLEAAGIQRAAGIIICLSSDKNILYVTMTARMMNDRIRIVSQMTNPRLEAKLYKAGANAVVSTHRIGALRLASEMIRPTAVDFLDSMLRSSQGTLRINQLTVPAGLAGQTIRELALRKRFNLLLLALKAPGQEALFDPDREISLAAGSDLVVMGQTTDVNRAGQWMRKQG